MELLILRYTTSGFSKVFVMLHIAKIFTRGWELLLLQHSVSL